MKKLLAGIKKFLENMAAGVRHIALALWAFVTTEGKELKDWHPDPWKISGLVAFALAALGAVRIFTDVKELGSDKLAVLGGLVSAAITVGTFLLNQAIKNDTNIRATNAQ